MFGIKVFLLGTLVLFLIFLYMVGKTKKKLRGVGVYVVVFVVSCYLLCGLSNPMYAVAQGGPATSVVSTASFYSNSESFLNPRWAKQGDYITLNFTLSEIPVAPPVVTIAGNSVTSYSAGSPSTFLASVVLDGTETEGLASYDIGPFTNAQGASFNPPLVTPPFEEGVTIDFTAPSIEAFTFESDYFDSGSALAGSSIDISFTSSELLDGFPSVTMLGGTTQFEDIEGTTYGITKEVPSVGFSGSIEYDISPLTDYAGNTFDPSANTPVANPIIVDSETLGIVRASASSTINQVPPLNTIHHASIGNTVSVSITFSAPLQFIPFLRINGRTVSLQTTSSNRTFNGSFLVNGTEEEGPLEFSVTHFEEGAPPEGHTFPVVGVGPPASFSIDTTAPTIESITLESDNENEQVAIEEDTISLVFTTSELLSQPPVVNLAGVNVQSEKTGETEYTAELLVTADTQEGDVTYTFGTIGDFAGNALVIDSDTPTPATGVLVETDLLSIVSQSLESGNSISSRHAKLNDTIIFTFTSSVILSSLPMVTIAGVSTNFTLTTTPNEYAAAIVLTGNEPEGAVTYDIEELTSITGETLDPAAVLSSGSSKVTIDFTNPTIESASLTIGDGTLGSQTAYLNETVTLLITTSEALNEAPTVSLAGSSVQSMKTGERTYTATITIDDTTPTGVVAYTVGQITDMTGNTSDPAPNTPAVPDPVTIDTTALSATFSLSSGNQTNTAYAKSGDTITLTITTNLGPVSVSTTTIAGTDALITHSGGNIYEAVVTLDGTEDEGFASFDVGEITHRSSTINPPETTPEGEEGIILDFTGPEVLTETLESNNSMGGHKANVDNTITLTFTVDEELSATPSATIAGQTVSAVQDSMDTLEYTATVTVLSNTPEEQVSYTIGTLTDLAGNNTISTEQRPTAMDGVSVDYTSPEVSSVTLTSDNEISTLYAKEEDVISLSIEFSETISALPTVMIMGESAQVTKNSDDTYLAEWEVDSTQREEHASYTIGAVTDIAGNTSTSVSATLHGTFGVFIDTTAPTLVEEADFEIDSESETIVTDGDTLTLNFELSEGILGGIEVSIVGETVTANPAPNNEYTATLTVDDTITEGAVSYTIDGFTDAAGNEFESVTKTFSDDPAVFVNHAAPEILEQSITTTYLPPAFPPPPTDFRYVAAGNVLIVTFSVSEPLAEIPEVTIMGLPAEVTRQAYAENLPEAYTGRLTVDENTPTGLVYYNIGLITDLGGLSFDSPEVPADVTNFYLIVDNVSPGIVSGETFTSDNTNTQYAKAGDVLTLNFTSTKELYTAPEVVIATRDATVEDLGSNAYQATLEVDGTEGDGVVAYNIGAIFDPAGNTFDPDLVTSTVTIDTTAPEISGTPTLTSDNTTNTLAKLDDVLTLNFTTSEALKNAPTVTIAGQSATVIGLGTTFSATLTVDSSATTGAVTYDINTITDLAGNTANPTSVESTVIIDTTAPKINEALVSISELPPEYPPAPANVRYAIVGNTVSVALAIDEELTEYPEITIADQDATVTKVISQTEGIPDNYVGSIVVDEDTTAGPLYYDVAPITNLVGLSFDFPKTSAALTSLNLIVDNALPGIESGETFTSDNANTQYAKLGDVLTLKFSSTEEIYIAPEVTIADRDATVEDLGSNAYQATLEVDGTEGDGVVAYNIGAIFDPAGNTFDPDLVTSTVTIDTTAPAIDGTPTLTSDNTTNTLAKIDDVLTLNFTTNEALASAPAVTIAGKPATVVGSGSTYAATLTVDSSTTTGAVTYDINTITDLAGNTANPDPVESTVIIDTTAPVISGSPTLASNNANTRVAIEGNTVTLTFTTSKALASAPTVTIAGQSVTATGSGTAYTAVITVDSNTTAGVVTYDIDTITDLTGNATNPIEVTLAGAEERVVIDISTPEISGVPVLKSDNSISTVARLDDTLTLTFVVTETLASEPAVTIAGQPAIVVGSGISYTATLTVDSSADAGAVTYDIGILTDLLGNSLDPDPVLSTIIIDTAGPEISGSPTLTSDNTTNTLAKIDDVLTLNFTTNEALKNVPTVTIAGQSVTATGSGSTYAATLTVDSSATIGTVTYDIDTITDLAGNTADPTPAESTVIIDTTPPAISGSPTLASNNTNTRIAVEGNTITLTFATSEALGSAPTVTIAGQSVTATGSGTAYSAVITVNSSTTTGTVTYDIATITDLAGNTANPIPVTLAGAEAVTVDITGPTISGSPTLTSDNAINTLAKINDILTLSFTTSETLASAPTVSIAGQSVTATGSGSTYTATLTVDSSATTGAVTYDINTLTDLNGNTSNPNPVTLTGIAEVIIDTTPPAISGSPTLTSDNTTNTLAKLNDVLTLNFNTNEALKSKPAVTIAGQPATVVGSGSTYTATLTVDSSATTGAVTYDIATITDFVGNTADPTAANSTVVIDTTPPVISGSPTLASNNANTRVAIEGNTVTLTFTTNEALKNAPTVTIAGQSVTATGSGTAYSAVITVDGNTTVGVVLYDIDTITDLVGNTSNPIPVTLVGAEAVTVDNTVPTISGTPTLTSDNATNTLATLDDILTLTFTTSETLASTPTASIAGQPATVVGSGISYTATLTVDSNADTGAVTYDIGILTDLTGNTSNPNPVTLTGIAEVIIDTTPPAISGSPTLTSDNTTNTLAKLNDVLTLNFTTNEALKSKPAVTIAGQPATVTGSGSTYTATLTVDSSATTGAVTYDIATITDLAGNTANPVPVESTGIIDTTPPAISGSPTLASNNTNTRVAVEGNTVTLTFTTSEALASAPTVTIAGQSVTATGSGTAYTAVTTVNGNTTAGVVTYDIDTITDLVGNTANPTSVTLAGAEAVTIDSTVPTISGTPTFTSDNATNTLATLDDTLTLTFTTSETLASTPAVTIAGQPATVVGSGISYTATLTVDSSANTGAVIYDIGRLTDLLGNSFDPNQVSSTILIDTSAPAISGSPTLTSDNTTNTLAKLNDVLTLNFNTNETLKSKPTVTIAGQPATVVGSGSTYAATLTVDSSATTGAVTYDIATITDFVGNTANPAPVTLAGAETVTIDSTVPTISGTPTLTSDNATNTLAKLNDVLTLNFNTSETLKSIPAVTIAGQPATVTGSGSTYAATLTVDSSVTAGTVTYDIATITDLAGNTSDPVAVHSTIVLDASIPGIRGNPTLRSDNSRSTLAKANDTITLTFVVSEALTSTPEVRIAGVNALVAETSADLTYTASITLTGNEAEGVASYDIGTITDLVGTTFDPLSVTLPANESVTIDFTVPTVQEVSSASNNTRSTEYAKVGDILTLDFTVSEALHILPVVNIAGQSARVESIGSNRYRATLEVSGTEAQGAIGYTISALTDLAGNVSTSGTPSLMNDGELHIDTISPTASLRSTRDIASKIGYATMTLAFNHRQSGRESVFGTISGGESCENLEVDSITGSSITEESRDVTVRGPHGTYKNCVLTLIDEAGNPTFPINLPEFKIKNRSEGGSSLVSPGYSSEVPTFRSQRRSSSGGGSSGGSSSRQASEPQERRATGGGSSSTRASEPQERRTTGVGSSIPRQPEPVSPAFGGGVSREEPGREEIDSIRRKEELIRQLRARLAQLLERIRVILEERRKRREAANQIPETENNTEEQRSPTGELA